MPDTHQQPYWTPANLARVGNRWFAFADSPDGVTVKVAGDDPQQVADIANRIEAALQELAS